MDDEACEHTWLKKSQCAHCLGHVGDWEEKERVKIYE
jgi:hypothetical protein